MIRPLAPLNLNLKCVLCERIKQPLSQPQFPLLVSHATFRDVYQSEDGEVCEELVLSIRQLSSDQPLAAYMQIFGGLLVSDSCALQLVTQSLRIDSIH